MSRLYAKTIGVGGGDELPSIVRLNPRTGAVLGVRPLSNYSTPYSYGFQDILVDPIDRDRWITKAALFGDTNAIVRGFMNPAPGVRAPTPIIEVIPQGPGFNGGDVRSLLAVAGARMLRFDETNVPFTSETYYAELVEYDGVTHPAVELFTLEDPDSWNQGYDTSLPPDRRSFHIFVSADSESFIYHWNLGYPGQTTVAPTITRGPDFPLASLGINPMFTSQRFSFGVDDQAYYFIAWQPGSPPDPPRLRKVLRSNGAVLWSLSLDAQAGGTAVVRDDGMIVHRLSQADDIFLALVSPVNGAIVSMVDVTEYASSASEESDFSFGPDLECYMLTSTHVIRVNAATDAVEWAYEISDGQVGRSVAWGPQPYQLQGGGAKECCPPGPVLTDFFSCPPAPVEPEPPAPPEEDDDDGEDDGGGGIIM